MRITPIEIKQKSFTLKSFGKGFDREEVQAFLKSLAQEWETLLDQNKEYQIKVELLEKEIQKLKEVETSLFRTLKTAEDTSANLVDQARKTADLKIREAQIKADVVLNDARAQAKEIVRKAQERARQALREMLDEMKSQERLYREMENYRDNFLVELRGFMNQSLDKVAHYETKAAHQLPPFAQKIQHAEAEIEAQEEIVDHQEVVRQQEQAQQLADFKPEALPLPQIPQPESGSFFDDLNA
ncbi:MAG: DivIVA domain-containing protein [Microscillaceae bacterium]|nr:DivIVA domain-containing protein [Microscillaceae bacterium]